MNRIEMTSLKFIFISWLTFSLVAIFLKINLVITLPWLLVLAPLLLPVVFFLLFVGYVILGHIIPVLKAEAAFEDHARSYTHKNPKPDTKPPKPQ